MKTCFYVCILLTIFALARGADEMTAERFKQLVAAPADTNALRAELAPLPFWKNSKCSVNLKYQDGHTLKETCNQSAKTVSGKYIVFSTESKLYNQTIYSVAGYDEKASAIRVWALYGDTLIQSTMVFDTAKKISASTSSYDDFMELSVGNSSTNELSDHALVYKDGVLFMTRDIKTRPAASTPAPKP